MVGSKEAGVGEALGLHGAEGLGGGRQAFPRDPGFLSDQGLDLAQEPGLVGAGRVDFLDRQAVAEGLGDDQNAVWCRHAQRPHDGGAD